MQILPSKTQHDAVVEAVRHANENNGEGYQVRLSLTAHPHTGPDVDLSEPWTEGEWGQSEVPITLDATVQGAMPRRLQDARVRLVTEVNGVPVHQMTGEKTLFLPGDDAYSTDLLTSTAGSLLTGPDAVKLDGPKDYPGVPPRAVVRDVTRRLPYDPSRVEIEDLPRVSVNFAGTGESPGFTKYEATGDVLSRLKAEKTVGYDFRDTATRGFVAWLPRPLGLDMGALPEEAGGYRTYSSLILPRWALERPQPPAERYSAVRVYCLDPETGRELWQVTEEIPYPQDVRPPHRNRTLDIPFEDVSAEGPTNGRRHARQEALKLARLTATGDQLTLPVFDPLIERGDPLTVLDTHRDLDGLWEMRWALRADSYKHLYGQTGETGVLSTQLSYSAILLEEDRVKAPDLIVPGPTRGVISTPRPAWGVEGDEIYFDTPTEDWVSTEGDELVFDQNENVTIDGDEIVVSD